MPQNRTILNNLSHWSIPNDPKTSLDSLQMLYIERLECRLRLMAPIFGAVVIADKVEKSMDSAF